MLGEPTTAAAGTALENGSGSAASADSETMSSNVLGSTVLYVSGEESIDQVSVQAVSAFLARSVAELRCGKVGIRVGQKEENKCRLCARTLILAADLHV